MTLEAADRHGHQAALARTRTAGATRALGKSISRTGPLNLAVTCEGSISAGRSRTRKTKSEYESEGPLPGTVSFARAHALPQTVRRRVSTQSSISPSWKKEASEYSEILAS